MVLSSTSALWITALVCAVTAALEGVCAGKNVRMFFQTVRFPRYAAPLWAWSIIGAMYYAIFGVVLFRLLSGPPPSVLAGATLTLIIAMMLGNALANVVIFRARNLQLGYVIGWLYAGLDALLLGLLLQLDLVAAMALVPYLMYRVYALWWGRALVKLNGMNSPAF